jgi:hypothetical protein
MFSLVLCTHLPTMSQSVAPVGALTMTFVDVSHSVPGHLEEDHLETLNCWVAQLAPLHLSG